MVDHPVLPGPRCLSCPTRRRHLRHTSNISHDFADPLGFVGGLSVFFLLMIVVYFFAEGGFAVVGPYSAEVWPSSLRTTGMGFSYGIGGIGKVIGPLGLALILGSSNLVKPKATPTDLVPAFSYFAAWYVLCALMFLLVGFETKGKSLEALDREIEAQRHGTEPVGLRLPTPIAKS